MWFARSGMMHALLGPVDPPIGNPEGKKGAQVGEAEAGEGSVKQKAV
jgi:hypothetical protein